MTSKRKTNWLLVNPYAVHVLGIIIFVTAIISAVTIKAKPANCAWCPSYPCYGSCGSGCVCVTPPGKFSGQCYGVQLKQHFENKGYDVK